MTPDQFFNTTPSDTSSTIKKYTIFGDEIIFPTTPSGTVEMWYFKRLSALSSATNTLFTSNPDLYLNAAMAEAQPFLKKWADMPAWEVRYAQSRDSVNLSHKQGRYPAGMSVKVA
jgi:hypothetical protein